MHAMEWATITLASCFGPAQRGLRFHPPASPLKHLSHSPFVNSQAPKCSGVVHSLYYNWRLDDEHFGATKGEKKNEHDVPQ